MKLHPLPSLESLPSRSTLLSLLLVLGLVTSFAVRAEPPVPPDGGHRHEAMGGGPELCPGFPFLRGVELSEAQKDKLFELFLAQARSLRDKVKALQKADADLRAAAGADEARLRPLVDARARAWSELTLQHLRQERQALEVLTPEQRRQVEELRAQDLARKAKGGRGMEPAAFRPRAEGEAVPSTPGHADSLRDCRPACKDVR